MSFRRRNTFTIHSNIKAFFIKVKACMYYITYIMDTAILKTKERRVQEGVTILKRIKGLSNDFGLFGQDPVFLQIKSAISTWVENGSHAELRLPMYRQERLAELILPVDERSASLNLKVLPFETPNDLD